MADFVIASISAEMLYRLRRLDFRVRGALSKYVGGIFVGTGLPDGPQIMKLFIRTAEDVGPYE